MHFTALCAGRHMEDMVSTLDRQAMRGFSVLLVSNRTNGNQSNTPWHAEAGGEGGWHAVGVQPEESTFDLIRLWALLSGCCFALEDNSKRN